MKRSELAELSGVGRETIRYYERRGLLEAPSRISNGGACSHPRSSLRRLHFIRYLKRLGFTLAEIAAAIEPWAAGTVSETEKVATLRAKLEAISEQRTELEEIESALRAQLANYD